MIDFTFGDAVRAVGGRYLGDDAVLGRSVASVVIDSRKAAAGSLYVPVCGERFDGHDFIPAARDAGAACVLTAHELAGEHPQIVVSDTTAALQKLASFYRELSGAKVIALTGSAGKTTTKELTASVLRRKYETLASAGNLNNQTGVPQTLFRLEPRHEMAVVEMGTNHPGEIDSLAACALPDAAVYTNIGTAHIEFFGSREGILNGKAELLQYLPSDGFAVINGDDDMLVRLKDRVRCVTYGMGKDCDVRAEDVRDDALAGVSFTLVHSGETVRVHIPAPGLHMVSNALAAAAVGLEYGVDMEDVRCGLTSFVPAENRMAVINTGRITILNDVYNANPSSMSSAIDVLARVGTRRVCILGDMFELGDRSARFHREVGAHAANSSIEQIICVGELSAQTAKGAGRDAKWFSSQNELIAALPGLIRQGDTVLVKGSRGMALEHTVAALKELM